MLVHLDFNWPSCGFYTYRSTSCLADILHDRERCNVVRLRGMLDLSLCHYNK